MKKPLLICLLVAGCTDTHEVELAWQASACPGLAVETSVVTTSGRSFPDGDRLPCSAGRTSFAWVDADDVASVCLQASERVVYWNECGLEDFLGIPCTPGPVEVFVPTGAKDCVELDAAVDGQTVDLQIGP